MKKKHVKILHILLGSLARSIIIFFVLLGLTLTSYGLMGFISWKWLIELQEHWVPALRFLIAVSVTFGILLRDDH